MENLYTKSLNDGDLKMNLKKILDKEKIIESIYFKSFFEKEIKEYIAKKMNKTFPEIKNSILRANAIEAIYFSHIFVRKYNGISSVSLRDLQRFRRAYKFFNEYYGYKYEFLNENTNISDKERLIFKVQSFILSLYITYYIKIFKSGYDQKYLETINVYVNNLVAEFENKGCRDIIEGKDIPFTFQNVVKTEEDFLLEEMKVKNVKGIGLNNSLKENIFLMFFSIYAHIPLIVVGKLGCSKSLSIQLIMRFIRGELSDSNFLKNYPSINNTGFQGSETNTPEIIENIFKIAEKKIDLSQLNNPDTINNIFKKALKKLEPIQLVIPESLKNIFINLEEEILKQLKTYEIIKSIFKESEEKIMNQSDISKSRVNIFKEIKSNILKYLKKSESDESEEKLSKPSDTQESFEKIHFSQLISFETMKNILEESEKTIDSNPSNNPETFEKIFKEEKGNILNQLNISKTMEKIFKEAEFMVLSQLNISEIIENIVVEAKEKIFKKFNEPESVMNDIKEAEQKILDNVKIFETIKSIFEEIKKKVFKKKYLSLLVFDELGLSEKSPTNCLKVLYSKLEMSLDQDNKNKISFIGISNWTLDVAKMNRTIFLAIPDIMINDIRKTVKAIADSYNKEIYEKNKKYYEDLGKLYFDYREKLKETLKDEFYLNYHGGRDLYNLVKIFSSEMIKKTKPEDGIKKALARNLNGLEINGESTLKKYITSYNFDNLKTMDLVIDNIISLDTRFLLLISENAMFSFLIDIIKDKIKEKNISSDNKINYVTYIGSPFKGDIMNNSYQTEVIVNIEKSVAEGKVIILSDLDQIYSVFYDLFNQNYIEKDGKKYCRISQELIFKN